MVLGGGVHRCQDDGRRTTYEGIGVSVRLVACPPGGLCALRVPAGIACLFNYVPTGSAR